MEPGKGLLRLPEPAAGDLFFDMEGDPLVEGGLEYLFGVYREQGGVGQFRAFWAHDRDQEREATGRVLSFLREHLTAHPAARIYHYNHYEPTALKRLASGHGVGEAMLDQLLREQRFVDLYRIVQQGVVTSEPGISLKDLEALYHYERPSEVATAGDSIVAYETWRETGDAAILEAIHAYNEADCRSTKGAARLARRDRPPGPTCRGGRPPPSPRTPARRTSAPGAPRRSAGNCASSWARPPAASRASRPSCCSSSPGTISARTSRSGGRCSTAPSATPRS